MKEYRVKLRTQNVIFTIGSLALIAVQVLAYTGAIRPAVNNAHWADFWSGFIAGAALGVTALLIVGLVRNLRAARSDEGLKKLFAKENDERAAAICEKGKSAGATASLCVLAVAAIISGYFNVTVSLTCVVCLFVQSLFMASGKLYYSKKL